MYPSTKHCNCCGKDYTFETWIELPCIGTRDDGFEIVEYRNCTCKTTLIVILAVSCPICEEKPLCDCCWQPVPVEIQ